MAADGGYRGDGHPTYSGGISQPIANLSASAPEFKPGNTEPYLRGGFFSQELGWWVPYYVGTLKSFNMRTGYGFLASQSTMEIYKNDIYIHKSQVPIPWKLGAYVEFAVTSNARGQPQATDVSWLPIAASLEEEKRERSAAQPRPAAAAAAGPAAAASASSGGQKNRHMGTLKSFSKMQGYGFISSEDIAEGTTGPQDVYLDRSQMPPERWTFGQAVEFEISFNHRGQPQARDVSWDPVPKMPLEVAGQAGAGMDLQLLNGANRAEGQQGIRNLSKVQKFLRDGDKSSAIKLAIDFQDGSEVIDYISFVLDRLGEPSTARTDLTGNVPMQLLIVISRLLRKHVFAPERCTMNLLWCEVIIPLLRNKADADSGAVPKTVLSAAQENLQKAKAASANPELFDTVIAKLAEAMDS